MKTQKYSFLSLIFFSLFTLTISAQSEAALLANVDGSKVALEKVGKATTTNMEEVLYSVQHNISEQLSIDSDLFQYYNSTVSFTIAFVIDEKGKIKKVRALNKAGGPIVSTVIRQIKALKKMPVVQENGIPVAKQIFLPIQLNKH